MCDTSIQQLSITESIRSVTRHRTAVVAGAFAMILAVLLLAHARADWVEITQLPNPHRTLRPKLGFESFETTEPYQQDRKRLANTPMSVESVNKKKNELYRNHSLEKHWNNGVVHRVSNIGHVRRIYLTTEEPASVKYEEIDLSAELPDGYSIRNPFKVFEEEKPQFVTKEEIFDDVDDDEIRFVRKPPAETWTEKQEIKENNMNRTVVSQRRVDVVDSAAINKKSPSDSKPVKNQKNKGDETKKSDNDPKVSTMENVLKFVKVVTDTITRNTRKSFDSKVKYLEDLKETIMVNIEDRIESLFPDDTPGKTSRRRRGAHAQPRGHGGHVEFPSSESALMTISFLTFAVYLIKLILQVIQAYKNKTMMMMPAVVAMGRNAANGR